MSQANHITSELLLQIPRRFDARCWRQNTGGGYPVAAVQAAIAMLARGQAQQALEHLRRARVVHFNPKGTPDIGGILGPSGRILGVEVKAGKDRQSDDQKACQRVYESRGGLYIVARDVEEALDEIERNVNS